MSLTIDTTKTPIPSLSSSTSKVKPRFSYFQRVTQNDSDLWITEEKLRRLSIDEASPILNAERVLTTADSSKVLKLTRSLSQKQLGRLYKVIHYMDGEAGRARRGTLNPILYHSVPNHYSSPSVQQILRSSLEYLDTLKLLEREVLKRQNIPGLVGRSHTQALEIIDELKTHLSEQLALVNQGVEVPFKPYYLYFQGENTYVSQVFIPPLPNSIRLVADIAIEALCAESILDCECSDSCESCQYKFRLQTPLTDLRSFSIIYADDHLDQEEKAFFETIVPKAFQTQIRFRMKSDVAQLKGALFNAFRTSLIPAHWVVNAFTQIPPLELPSLNQLKEMLQKPLSPSFDLPKFTLYPLANNLKNSSFHTASPADCIVSLFGFLPNEEKLRLIFLKEDRTADPLPLIRSALKVWYHRVENGKSISYLDLISLKDLLSVFEQRFPDIDRTFILTYFPKVIQFLSVKNKEYLARFVSGFAPKNRSDGVFIEIVERELAGTNTQQEGDTTSSPIQPNKKAKH